MGVVQRKRFSGILLVSKESGTCADISEKIRNWEAVQAGTSAILDRNELS
jgi:hypothetical protein